MKKVLAIFLLAVTFYNAGGYMVAFEYFIFKSDKLKERQISKDQFKEADLVEIKIPAQMPGIDPWRGYEPVSGSVQLAQNSYNYVRMKMTTDTIYVMCVPNYKSTKLKKDNVICAREVSDAPLNAKKQNSPVKSVNIIKYIAVVKDHTYPIQRGLALSLPNRYDSQSISGNPNAVTQPPELISC